MYYHQIWDLKKPVVRGKNGVVSSQHYLASEIGAEVLRAGGNAVDAAIAASFAVSVVEPWMSGLGGGGYIQLAFAEKNDYRTIHMGMRSPRYLNSKDYPLAEGDNTSGDLFAWPSVEGDRNIIGYSAIAVPGQVAGIALAHKRYGTIPWKELLQPAIQLANDGLPITWHMSLRCLGAAKELKDYPASARIYLDECNLPLQPIQGKPIPLSPLGNLPDTLRRLAEAGGDDFYCGDLAQAVVADLRKGGNTICLEDFSSYQATETASLPIPYRGITVHAAPDMTAGPTIARVIELAGPSTPDKGPPTAKTFADWARSLEQAYRERFDTMGDIGDGCTSHLTVADKDGNLVSLTQTLLSVFGSRVTLPETGILMNNGIYWFDPRSGKPNSLAPDKKALSNMCPAIIEKDGQPWFAIGASGGRRIMPAVFQVLSMIGVSHMDLDAVAHAPRIDVCGEGRATVDPELSSEVRDAIAEQMPVFVGENTVYPHLYACPNIALRDPKSGEFAGFTHIMTPPSATVAA